MRWTALHAAVKVLFQVRVVEATLREVSESAIREVVGQASLDGVLGSARLRITAPFAGTALLSLQREEILESRVLMMTNATTVVEIPVTAAMHPSIRATASVIHPADAESSWTARRAAGEGRPL